MKSYYRILAAVLVLITFVILGVNLTLHQIMKENRGRTYRVEINRLHNEILESGIKGINLEQYVCISKVSRLNEEVTEEEFFQGDDSDYVIRYIGGSYYRMDYDFRMSEEYGLIRLVLNLSLGIMAAVLLAVILYIRSKLLQPFHKLKEVPYELSKGNLQVGLKENKSRYFGRFIWGLDLLRENLEKQRTRELELQKEKKTLVLSVSHDIKTPLSAIHLYAKALSKNLYHSDEKRIEIADNISAKVLEIEGYVSQIMEASSEDFLSLEVKNGEFYLTEVLDKIKAYYTDKLELLKIPFTLESCHNCLIKGDPDRVVEVLQNIMENAIKYGDGNNINITVSSEEDCRLITIANSGSTLPDHELPHIFESFWRGSNAGKQSGSGLGLYICRQLMKKMSGDIYAESRKSEMRITIVLRMA